MSPNELVRRARKGIIRRRPHVVASRIAFNALYRLAGGHKGARRRDEVVFLSRQADEPSYDFAELARCFEEHGWTATMHLKKVTKRNLPSYLRHAIVEIRLLARCKVAVLDRYDPIVCLIDFDCEPWPPALTSDDPVNLDFPRFPVVLQLWHAFGSFKKFGFQYVDAPEGHPADFMADWRIHRNYSWIACSGEGARQAFAEAFSCPAERVVPLRRPEYDELLAHAADQGADTSITLRRPRVLMAPTLRRSPQAAHPFRDLFRNREAFERGFDADVVWAFHPLEAGLPAPGNVSDALLDCDIVVTDYSSLVYEAFLLGKQVLFYIPDIEEYRVTSGLNRDPLELSPLLCAVTEQELVELLRSVIGDPARYPTKELNGFIGPAFDGADQSPVDFVISHT